MSYEGYSQYICKKGHYFTRDAYDDMDYDDHGPYLKYPKCPYCGEDVVWRNGVDQTNCCGGVANCAYELSEEEIQECKYNGLGFIELEEDCPAVICQCDKCGNEHKLEPPTYKIPAGRGHKLQEE